MAIFFRDITQPELQIANICTAVTNLFKSYIGDDKIKVSLIACKNKICESYLYISDDTSSVSIDDLNTHKTTAKSAILKQKMIVIENVNQKKKKDPFWCIGNSKIKSIIAYPICYGRETVFLICVTAKNKSFRKKDEKRFQFIFEEFGQRILLESYLLDIRNKCQDI